MATKKKATKNTELEIHLTEHLTALNQHLQVVQLSESLLRVALLKFLPLDGDSIQVHLEEKHHLVEDQDPTVKITSVIFFRDGDRLDVKSIN